MIDEEGKRQAVLEYGNARFVHMKASKLTPLRQAVANQDFNKVEKLISEGADVTQVAPDGSTIFQMADSTKMRRILARAWPNGHPGRLHAKIIAELDISRDLFRGADCEARWDRFGFTPLITSATLDDMRAAQLLITTGACLARTDTRGLSAFDLAKSPQMRQLLARAWPQDHPRWLHVLAEADLTDEIADAVAAGADVNVRWPRDDGTTALMAACAAGRDQPAAALIRAGASTTVRDENGFTPLLMALDSGSIECLTALISAGADVAVLDNTGRSALDLARSSTTFALLARAWKIDQPGFLHAMACASHTDSLVDAVAAGADVDAKWGVARRTPIHWAAVKNSLAAAEVLIEAGADVTILDSDGRSAIFRARDPLLRQALGRAWPTDDPARMHMLAQADCAGVLSAVIRDGADVNARFGRRKASALVWAIERNSLAAAKVLLEAGIDVSSKDNNGKTALSYTRTNKARSLLMSYKKFSRFTLWKTYIGHAARVVAFKANSLCSR